MIPQAQKLCTSEHKIHTETFWELWVMHQQVWTCTEQLQTPSHSEETETSAHKRLSGRVACGHFTGGRHQSVQQLGSASCRHSTRLDTESLAQSSARKSTRSEKWNHTPTAWTEIQAHKRQRARQLQKQPLEKASEGLPVCLWKMKNTHQGELQDSAARSQDEWHKLFCCFPEAAVMCKPSLPTESSWEPPCALHTAPVLSGAAPAVPTLPRVRQPGLCGCWSRVQGKGFCSKSWAGFS